MTEDYLKQLARKQVEIDRLREVSRELLSISREAFKLLDRAKAEISKLKETSDVNKH